MSFEGNENTMYGTNEHFKSPKNDDMIIWRYMNLEKFEWMLRDKALYFCNSEQFEDKFEGSTTPLNKIVREITYSDKYKTLKTNSLLLYRKMIHINCWHMDINESRGMWDLYTKKSNGIAIKSTLGDFKDAIENDKHLTFISKVYYLDYEKSYIQENCLFNEFLCKRNGYDHEKELRALFLKGYDLSRFSESEIRGTNVVTNLEVLINQIVLCPEATPQFEKEVNKIITDYGYGFPVSKSELSREPLF